MHPINAHAADSASAVLEGQSRGPSGEFEHERSLEITAEQEFVIELLKEGHNVFVTGPGGVGKSFLVRKVLETLLILDEVSLISAGLLETLDMVLRVVRARAARSAFLLRERVKGKMTDEAESKITITDGSLIRWRELGIGDSPPTGAMKTRRHTTPEGLFDLIEEECLSKPFGGIQILVVGDFFQLPPVKPIAMLSDGYLVKPTTVTQMPVEVQEKTSSPPIAINDPHLAPGPTQTSGRIFAFETPLWSECGFRAVRLTHVFRQTDSKFVRILNSVRKGDVTHEVVRVLSTRVCDLTPDEDRFVTRLTSRRDQAARENSLKLCSLPGPLIRMVAVDGCSVSTLPHLDVDEDGDAVLADNLLKSVNVGEVVELKIGARIILLSNVDVAAGLANGVKGTVESLAASPPRALRSHHHYPRLWYSDDDKTDEEIRASLDEWYDISPGLPVVWFDSGVTRLIEPTCTAVEIEGKKVAWRAQVPLVVGYALTIHKVGWF
ncbi:hypothetical protein M427DRAFT_45646 [Gonapodya prolifera JEL478]|uniref:DNA helicase Pif1-like 2B domain-containing protein n=1 Tax=Gonapodya prolifera (strain JEL478) TaxID=1344416 RepID=A0A139A9L0_GONPJ|nr:hypothetical protein M427DRAFT_45646 [Gonapodya prolifera JEL478]|eukprot:KXS13512.1 hypothetical protein M427DRAFT_45646 [Gonapodya prolifera JEL478]